MADDVSTERGSRARDHLANERTYLAWLRVSATVMVVGLAAAEFVQGGTGRALIVGGVLIALGTLGVVQGMVRYRRINREIEAGRFVTGASSSGPLWAGVALLVAVLGAAAFLL